MSPRNETKRRRGAIQAQREQLRAVRTERAVRTRKKRGGRAKAEAEERDRQTGAAYAPWPSRRSAAKHGALALSALAQSRAEQRKRRDYVKADEVQKLQRAANEEKRKGWSSHLTKWRDSDSRLSLIQHLCRLEATTTRLQNS